MINIQNFNYVEFEDFFLIETEEICSQYYFNLQPVYDLYGYLKFNISFNDNKKIDLPLELIKLFGIKHIISPEYDEININELILKLSIASNIILCIFYYKYFYTLLHFNTNYSKTFPYLLAEFFINIKNIINNPDISYNLKLNILSHNDIGGKNYKFLKIYYGTISNQICLDQIKFIYNYKNY